MSTETVIDQAKELFRVDGTSVVGPTDRMIELASEHRLEMRWRGEELDIKVDDLPPFQLSIRNSYYRGVLARLSFLLGQQNPLVNRNVYFGRGILRVTQASGEPRYVEIDFDNSLDAQWAMLRPAKNELTAQRITKTEATVVNVEGLPSSHTLGSSTISGLQR